MAEIWDERDRDADVTFATSGHTGEQVWWVRTASQLRAEADLVASELVGKVDEIICFAPPGHLFGRLFGVELPQLRRVPVHLLHDDSLRIPELRPGHRVLFVCLPASWLMLERLIASIARLKGAVMLHGTGPTTPATGRVMAAVDAEVVHAVEIFGSTETGGIASRPFSVADSATAAWHLLPDVELEQGSRPDADGLVQLGVHSPRLARRAGESSAPGLLWLDDMIRPLDGRRFLFAGRSSRLIKINGKRIDLGAVERALSVTIKTDVVCVPVSDPVRGEHFDLIYATADTGITDEQVWRRLAERAQGQPMPRSVRGMPEIPRSATGKARLTRLPASPSLTTPGGPTP